MKNLTSTPLKVKHNFNCCSADCKGKTFSKPSLTRPNLSMTVTEIIKKYASGNLPEQKMPIYDENGTSLGINPKTLDLTELAALRDRYARAASDMKNEFNRRSKAKKEAAKPSEPPVTPSTVVETEKSTK